MFGWWKRKRKARRVRAEAREIDRRQARYRAAEANAADAGGLGISNPAHPLNPMGFSGGFSESCASAGLGGWASSSSSCSTGGLD